MRLAQPCPHVRRGRGALPAARPNMAGRDGGTASRSRCAPTGGWRTRALATLVLIVFSGAGVRLTGSGLGCPSWPDCSGTFLPRARHPRLDRVRQPAVLDRRRRRRASPPACSRSACGRCGATSLEPAHAAAAGVVAQGVLGGMTVLLHLLLAGRHRPLPALDGPAGRRRRARLARAVARRASVPRQLTGSSCWARACSWSTARVVIIAGTLATAAGPHAGGAGTGDVVERLDAFGARNAASR